MEMKNLRQVYGETLVRLGGEHDNLVVLDADLSKSTMSCLFQQAFPQRFFEMGIAEQNMASFAAGLALTGKVAFINSFAVFASGRAYDQIRQGICIPALNVKIMGSSTGLSDFGDGSTHQAVEDVAIMRAIPNMTVLAPADAAETEMAVEAAFKHEGPVYIRVNRNNMPDVTPAGYRFEIGKPCVIRDGCDFTVLAHGLMVGLALKAAESLGEEGISVRVVNVSTLKPVDEKEILRLCKGMKGVVTAEEHSLIGGLAAIAAGVLAGTGIPVRSIGIRDSFGQSAESYEELLEAYGLTEKAVTESIRTLL